MLQIINNIFFSIVNTFITIYNIFYYIYYRKRKSDSKLKFRINNTDITYMYENIIRLLKYKKNHNKLFLRYLFYFYNSLFIEIIYKEKTMYFTGDYYFYEFKMAEDSLEFKDYF